MSVGISSASNPVFGNPIDLIEEIVVTNDWNYERPAKDEIVMEIAGRWCDYRLLFMMQRDLNALYFSSLLDMRIDRGRASSINNLIAKINEMLWLGHFTICTEERMPMFRHTLMVRGPYSVNVEQLEDLLDVAMNECERFYPAFQFVQWGGRTPDDAIAASMLDPVGEA